MTVTSAAGDLHTDSATLDGVIEGLQVVEAPLNGRNVNNLLDFLPAWSQRRNPGSTMANGGSGNFKAGNRLRRLPTETIRLRAFTAEPVFIDGAGSNIAENNVNTLVLTRRVQEFRVSTTT